MEQLKLKGIYKGEILHQVCILVRLYMKHIHFCEAIHEIHTLL